ncbi:MAG: hypothetical protein CMM59_21040 [Rhodospirillaceae bacterium]|nr:hypothetical protein [Rhodospirillaceae bacterium]
MMPREPLLSAISIVDLESANPAMALQPHRYQHLLDWLSRSAFSDMDVPQLQNELIGHLENLGMRFYRMHIGLPMLHPLYSIGTYTWGPDQGVVLDNFQRGLAGKASWKESPLRPFYEDGSVEGRITIRAGSESDRFSILKSAAENGATDYFVQFTNFPDRSIPVDAQEGIALTWTSNAPGGFAEEALEVLRAIRLPLCAQLKNLTHRRLVDDILAAYLGPYSGKRVRDGQIQRGDGDVIDAVILFCDLRGSSTLAEHYDLDGFLTVLNDYYEITAGAVIEEGGEILRYIGDASLAIFPFERYEPEQKACQYALRAALQAAARGREVNADRRARGEPAIDFGIGLHVGQVMYGNIGTPKRIEFTVIGQAANEAARIEAQCKELGETILVSDRFAELLNHPWKSHGAFTLRNIGRPIEIYSPVS